MGIPAQRVQPLQMGRATEIDGVHVTPLDANHCPGAAMFLFRVPGATRGSAPQVSPALFTLIPELWPSEPSPCAPPVHIPSVQQRQVCCPRPALARQGGMTPAIAAAHSPA